MDGSIPPLPPGATLDQGLPPLPPGVTLDKSSPPQLPDASGIRQTVQNNLSRPQGNDTETQPSKSQSDSQRLDTGLGMSVSSALRGGKDDTPLPTDIRGHLMDSYAAGTSHNAGDYMQTALPVAAHAANEGLNVALQRTGRDVMNAAGMVAGFIPDSIARLMYTGAQQVGLIPKDISVNEIGGMSIPSVGEATNNLAKIVFPKGDPQNNLDRAVDQAAMMTATLPLAGGATLPVTAWRAIYMGAAGVFGAQAQQAASNWARNTFPNQPFIQESITQAANFGTMLGIAGAGHVGEAIIPGHEALKPIVADVIGKPVESITPQDINETIAKGFTDRAPKAQDFQDVATVMSSQVASHGTLSQAIDGQQIAAPLQENAAQKSIDQLIAETRHPQTGLTYEQSLEKAENLSRTSDINTPERQQLRNNIANEIYGNGAERKEGVIHIVTGAPGAGKSSAVVDNLAKQTGSMIVDSDMVKEKLPEYDHGNGANAVHKESVDIARKSDNSILSKALQNKDNIVMPVVGKDYEGLANEIERYKKLGYDVRVSHVDATEENSFRRILSRFGETGRSIPLDYIKGAAERIRDVYQKIKENPNVSGYANIDNNGSKPVVTESRNYADLENAVGIDGGFPRGNRGDAGQTYRETAGPDTIADTLRKIYAETGKRPDQVFEDAKTNPDIMADIAAGKIPSAYDHLRPVPEKPEKPLIAEEGPLSHPPALTKAREFEDQLHQLSTNITADRLDVIRRAEAAPDLPRGEWEKMYHHEENPSGVSLTPKEQAIYDEHVKPIKEESEKLFARLESLGYPEIKENEAPDNTGYTPRYVKGRTRSYGEVLEQAKEGNDVQFGGAAGRSMRKTIDAQKSRRFYDAVNPNTGERQLVYIDKEHNAIAFETPDKSYQFGSFGGGQKLAPGSEIKVGGEPWRLENTTTKKIEDETNIRYTKNVMANRLDQLSKLRAAVRNAEFIEAMKNSPEFENVAVPVTDVSVPPDTNGRQWRPPKLLQFRNYYMEPKLADALDDFARDQGNLEGLSSSLNKIGRVMNFVMFLNPKAHIDNVFNHMMVERGLVGNIFSAPSTIKNLIEAAKDVYDVSPEYTDALRAGASLPYAKMLGGDVHAKLIEKLGFDMDGNPSIWNQLAQVAGYSDAGTMFRRLSSVPQRVLWFTSDVMTLSRIKQLEDSGEPLEDAIKETESHMPNYRVPGQVAGSRALSELFANPAVGRFGRYQYGRLASYFRMLNDAFGSGQSIGQRAQSFDRMAMIGAYMFLFYPLLDEMWQKITGNPNASTIRSGAISVPNAVMEAAQGKRTIGDILPSVFTPGVPLEVPMELYSGRYLWNGEPIVRQADVDAMRPQAAIDALDYAGSKLSAVGQMGGVAEGKMTPEQMGMGLIGVKEPTEKQIRGQKYYKQKGANEARRRANRLEEQREAQE